MITAKLVKVYGRKRESFDLGIAPYIGIGIVCGLLNIATDKDN